MLSIFKKAPPFNKEVSEVNIPRIRGNFCLTKVSCTKRQYKELFLLPKNHELFTLPDTSTKKLGLGTGEASFSTFQKPNSKRTFVYRFHEDVSLICGEGETQDSFMIVYGFESEGHQYFTCEYHTVKNDSIDDTPHVVRIKPYSGKDEDFMDAVIDIVLLEFGLKTSVYGDITLNDNQ